VVINGTHGYLMLGIAQSVQVLCGTNRNEIRRGAMIRIRVLGFVGERRIGDIPLTDRPTKKPTLTPYNTKQLVSPNLNSSI